MSEEIPIPDEWYFITAPQSVSWDKSSKTKTVDTYGTNSPYLNYGSTQLRKLSLSDAMLEGFSDGKEVEGNITSLEACMKMIIDAGSGYTAPYCWKVFAADKCYGTYIITDVGVQEDMRDTTGKATRAHVDIQLQQVSEHQVNSGTDITSTAMTGGITPESEAALTEAQKQDQAAANSKSDAGTNSTGEAAGNEEKVTQYKTTMTNISNEWERGGSGTGQIAIESRD